MNDVDDDSSGVLTRPVKGGALRARAPVMLATAGWDDYALLDSGNGRKLERYGGYRVVRPEEQAMWSPRRPAAEWEEADAQFVGIGEDDADGRWRFRKPLGETWPLAYDGRRLPWPVHLVSPCRRLSRAGRALGLAQGQNRQWTAGRRKSSISSAIPASLR